VCAPPGYVLPGDGRTEEDRGDDTGEGDPPTSDGDGGEEDGDGSREDGDGRSFTFNCASTNAEGSLAFFAAFLGLAVLVRRRR